MAYPAAADQARHRRPCQLVVQAGGARASGDVELDRQRYRRPSVDLLIPWVYCRRVWKQHGISDIGELVVNRNTKIEETAERGWKSPTKKLWPVHHGILTVPRACSVLLLRHFLPLHNLLYRNLGKSASTSKRSVLASLLPTISCPLLHS